MTKEAENLVGKHVKRKIINSYFSIWKDLFKVTNWNSFFCWFL